MSCEEPFALPIDVGVGLLASALIRRTQRRRHAQAVPRADEVLHHVLRTHAEERSNGAPGSSSSRMPVKSKDTQPSFLRLPMGPSMKPLTVAQIGNRKLPSKAEMEKCE